jgi:hypothetical protein
MKTIRTLIVIYLSLTVLDCLGQPGGVTYPPGLTNRISPDEGGFLPAGAATNGLAVVPRIVPPRGAIAANPDPGGAAQGPGHVGPLDGGPGCATAPGLVAWWRGEGDALDVLGLNNGTLQGGAGFAPGMVGYAFDLNGSSAYVDVPDSPSLDPTAAITVEAWICPRPPLDPVAAPIVKKAGEGQGTDHGYSLELSGPSAVAFWVFLNGQGWIPSPAAALPANQWSHVAGVYDGSRVALYLNGQLVGTPTYAPSLILASGNHLQIGHDPSNPGRYFHGQIDEASVYNTALSAGQIQGIYSAGSVGKCLAPVIVTQPQSQQVPLGANASLNVVAGGPPRLSYQWFRNGNSLAGAMASTLALPNVQLTDSGTYTVVVSNPYGSTVSAGAVLTVYVPTCVQPPAGLAGWWAGEGNAYDSLCANNGTFQGVPTFGAGTVGQAFDLDGTSRYVDVGNGVGLSPTAAITVEGWIYPRLPLDPVAAPVLKKAGGGGYWGQDNGYSLELAGSSSIRFWLFLDGGRGWTASASAPLSANWWSHVAGVYDGASISVYVNGVLVGPATAASGQIVSSAHNLQIGHDPSNPRYFNGLIDEASLYNRALSASEIHDIYASGIAGKCPPGPPDVHLIGVSDGTMLSGVVTISVGVGCANGNLANLCLTENDSPVSGAAILTPPFPSPVQIVLDTTQMANGVHQIVARARWDSPGTATDEEDSSYEADSLPVTVNVFNEISFPNWMPSFGEMGNSLAIEAQSAHASADWYVSVYDSQNLYIGTLFGHTSDGSIEVAWNLIGPYGDTHYNDPFFSFVVTTYFAGGGTAMSVAPRPYRVTDTWSRPGQWVMVAQHAWDDNVMAQELYAELDGFVTLAQNAGWSVSPPPDRDGHAFTLHFDTTGQDPQGASDWAGFRSALYNSSSRNLIYLGHGGPDGLGRNPNSSTRFISATQIGSNLHTVPAGQANRHAYRMVIADGCGTGSGALVSAFGIIPKEDVSGAYYSDASLRPSAFMGWSSDKYISVAGALNTDHVHFIQGIAYYMTLGYGIKPARVAAGWRPDVNRAWVHPDDFKVYGYGDLTFWADNTR